MNYKIKFGKFTEGKKTVLMNDENVGYIKRLTHPIYPGKVIGYRLILDDVQEFEISRGFGANANESLTQIKRKTKEILLDCPSNYSKLPRLKEIKLSANRHEREVSLDGKGNPILTLNGQSIVYLCGTTLRCPNCARLYCEANKTRCVLVEDAGNCDSCGKLIGGKQLIGACGHTFVGVDMQSGRVIGINSKHLIFQSVVGASKQFIRPKDFTNYANFFKHEEHKDEAIRKIKRYLPLEGDENVAD